MNATTTESTNDLPLACSLSNSERLNRGDTIAVLFDRAQAAKELEDGYRFEFPSDPDLLHGLVGWIPAERACCPFFTFVLTFTPAEGPIRLDIRGPEGVKEFLHGTAVESRFLALTASPAAPECSAVS